MKLKIFTKASFISVMLVMLTSGLISAQAIKVTGTVTDAKSGQPLPGVNIAVEGTSTGTITDIEGQYSITVSDPNATLVFSFVGYVTDNISISNRTTIDVAMVEDIMSLDQVVVVGYGTQKKSDLTGAVSVVNTENMNKVTSNDISKVLQGQASGVQVHSSGEPGAVPIVNIRGIGSFTDASPLYVVDGVPVVGLADFTPSDIESVQILKDASASAIYGARGANGVVIITTKRGQSGKMKVTFDADYGRQNIVKRFDLTNRQQFQEMNNLANTNDGYFMHPGNNPDNAYYITDINTDWQKEAFKPGHITTENLSISGGGDNSTYNINLNYFDQTGTLKGPGPRYKRYSVKVNTDQSRGKFKFSESFYYANSDQIKLTNSQWGNPIYDVLTAIPTIPVYDPVNKGGYGGANDTVHGMISPNEVAFNNIKHSWGKRNRFLGIISGEYQIIPSLKYKINLSYDRTDWYDHEFVPEFNVGSREINAIAYLNEWRGENPYMLMEHTLTFDKTFGKHHLTLLAGYTAQYDYWERVHGHAEGYTEPYFEVLSAGTSGQTSTGEKYEHTMISYLGRINYSYNDKYLITANFRRDASSRFGPNNKWGNFPSLAGAWKVNNEPFFNVDFINLLKLRAGYGIIGNEKIGDYLYETTLNNNVSTVFVGNSGAYLAPGTTQINLVDPSIHWEQKKTQDFGIDVAMFRNRLEFSAEYYKNDASGLLLQLPIPWSTGSLAYPTTNAASMTNSGVEFSVTFRNVEGNFHYSISGNLSTLKNEVTSLGKTDNPVVTYMSKTEVGQPMGELYGYVFEGIFQNDQQIADHAFQTAYTKPGDCMFKDVNNDGVINTDDRVYLGRAFPNLTGGLNIDMDYKGFDLSVFLQGVSGNKVFNGEYQITNAYQEGNYSVESYNNYWRGEGTTNQYPRLTRTDANQNNRTSARFIQNGSYLRVQNVQLGYDLTKFLLRNVTVISGFRIYISAQNLLTFTKYTGYDPDFTNGGYFYRAQDNGSYPSPRTLSAGLKASF